VDAESPKRITEEKTTELRGSGVNDDLVRSCSHDPWRSNRRETSTAARRWSSCPGRPRCVASGGDPRLLRLDSPWLSLPLRLTGESLVSLSSGGAMGRRCGLSMASTSARAAVSEPRGPVDRDPVKDTEPET
jgi:hypothetical protein